MGCGEESILPPLNFSLKKDMFFWGGKGSFLEVISLGGGIIDINLSRTYEKLNCKGEPYRFIGTDRHIEILLLLYKDKTLFL